MSHLSVGSASTTNSVESALAGSGSPHLDSSSLKKINGMAVTNVQGRYQSLDGLRGTAALSVVLSHFFCAYVPNMIPGQTSTVSWVSDTPLAYFYNGPFCVSVFFVLSAFVVSNSATKRQHPLAVNFASRYCRLGLPILASILFAWALMKAMPGAVHDLKVVLPHPWLNSVYDHNLPSIRSAVAEGLFGVFAAGYSPFNGALWSMRIELIGSLAIYLVYSLIQGKARLAVLVLLAVIFLIEQHHVYLCFALGSLLREAVAAKRLDRRWGWPALLGGLIVGAEMYGWGSRSGLPLPSSILSMLGQTNGIVAGIGGTLIVYSVLVLDWLNRFLSTKVPQFLGRISFSLYLVHAPLLYTVFALLFVKGTALLVLLLAFLVIAVMVGAAFNLLVDEPVLRLLKLSQASISALRNGGGTLEASTPRNCRL